MKYEGASNTYMNLLQELEERRRRIRSRSESAKYFHGVIYESDFCTNHAQKFNSHSGGSQLASRIEADFNFNAFIKNSLNSIHRSGDACVQQ